MADPSPSIVVYRTAGCPFCVAAERLLNAKDVPFEQVYLDDHPDRYSFVANKPGHFTGPLIVIDGEPIGGYDQLTVLDRSGRLDEMLSRG